MEARVFFFQQQQPQYDSSKYHFGGPARRQRKVEQNRSRYNEAAGRQIIAASSSFFSFQFFDVLGLGWVQAQMIRTIATGHYSPSLRGASCHITNLSELAQLP
jgi:hypothetical protein